MKLVVLFLGLTALAAALSVPIMTEGWEMGPGPQLLNPEVLDTGAITCQECNKRFRRCVEVCIPMMF